MMLFYRNFGALVHLSGKGAITKGGSVAAFVPRRPSDRASRPDKFQRSESKITDFVRSFNSFSPEIGAFIIHSENYQPRDSRDGAYNHIQ